MSMTISCTWAGQSTDQTTLGITRVCVCAVAATDGMPVHGLGYQVTDMDGRGLACVWWQRPQLSFVGVSGFV